MAALYRLLFGAFLGFGVLSATPLAHRHGASAQQPNYFGAMPYPTPLVYYRWWNDVQECLGKTRNLNEIKFYVVNTPSWDNMMRDSAKGKPYQARIVGKYIDKDSAIYIGLGGEGVSWIVSHEMAHAILRHVYNTHPDSIYEHGRCAHLFHPRDTTARDTT